MLLIRRHPSYVLNQAQLEASRRLAVGVAERREDRLERIRGLWQLRMERCNGYPQLSMSAREGQGRGMFLGGVTGEVDSEVRRVQARYKPPAFSDLLVEQRESPKTLHSVVASRG